MMPSMTLGAGPPSPRPSGPRAPPRPARTYCRAVLLGLTGVGKTALTVRLLTKRFIGEYCPTLESLYCYRGTVENEDVRMEIFDTAGMTAEDCAPEAYVLWANCFLLVYAINDRRSFEEVARLKRRIDALKVGSSPPCVLVGNKSDLERDRRVRRYEGQRLARLLGCTHFFETSARDGNHVSHIADMFHTLHADFRRHRAILRAADGGTGAAVAGAGGVGAGGAGGACGGRAAAPQGSSGGLWNKPAATGTKFRSVIQKVIMRSKTPAAQVQAQAQAQVQAPAQAHAQSKPSVLAMLGPSRESIV